MKSTYKPAWWLPGPHAQTLWPTFARKKLKIKVERERVELADGDFIDLDWSHQGIQTQPIVVILHGLEGSSASPYARGMLQAINAQGWRGVVMHFRGCSGEPNRLPRAYHSGETKDIAAIIHLLRAREPQTPLVALGYSLGGNVLLKWLGESGTNNPLTAAAAISVPLELAKTSQRLQKGFSKIYQRHLLQSLRKKMVAKKPDNVMLTELKMLRSLQEFDDKFTAPMHGFTGAQDYYSQSSSRQFLKKIAIPTLLIQAVDDPFLTPDMIPAAAELAACLQLEVTASGGHVGFVMGNTPWRPQYWLEQRIPEFLKDYIS
jgi:predicted alpha/beta-fold hydrolase